MATPEVLKTYKTVEDTINEAFSLPESADVNREPRLLVVGTNAEVRKLRGEYGETHDGLKVHYCSSIHRFKKAFLGQYQEADEISIPEKVVTTGYMRADVHFSETIFILDRLKALSEKYQITLEELESFHL